MTSRRRDRTRSRRFRRSLRLVRMEQGKVDTVDLGLPTPIWTGLRSCHIWTRRSRPVLRGTPLA